IEQDYVGDMPRSGDLGRRRKRSAFLFVAQAQPGIQRLFDETALTRTADAGDRTQDAQGKVDIEILQVVRGGATQLEKARRLAASLGNLGKAAARPEIARRVFRGVR